MYSHGTGLMLTQLPAVHRKSLIIGPKQNAAIMQTFSNASPLMKT